MQPQPFNPINGDTFGLLVTFESPLGEKPSDAYLLIIILCSVSRAEVSKYTIRRYHEVLLAVSINFNSIKVVLKQYLPGMASLTVDTETDHRGFMHHKVSHQTDFEMIPEKIYILLTTYIFFATLFRLCYLQF